MIDGASIWGLLAARAAADPDGVCAVDERDRTLTFAELRARAERVAAGLFELGVEHGTRVSWQLPTRLESFVLVGALCRLGAVQNPMLPIYREREVRYILGEVKPRVFVVSAPWRGFDYPELATRVVEELAATAGLECDVVVSDGPLPEGDPARLPPPTDDATSTHWVFYTSGTTADPKGALHSDATIVAGARGTAAALELVPDDRYAMVFPFTHIGGIGMLAAQLLTGAGAILVEQFDPDDTPRVLGAHGVTIPSGGTPLAIVYLQYQRRHPEARVFPRARAVITGSAPKPPGLHGELQREIGGVGAVSVYGLTEAPFLVAASVHDPDDKLATTEGRAIAGVELRIVGDDGRVCAPGATGEIRARGDVICGGYLDPTNDEAAFDADGFFRTGDLGSLDAAGYLTVSGRIKDVIIRKGENISAKEVEDVLYDHPKVAEVAVVGLDDAELGERCCAVVMAVEGTEPLELAELLDLCDRAGLARQKWPEQLQIVDDFPRNASGKVLKYALQEQLSTAGRT